MILMFFFVFFFPLNLYVGFCVHIMQTQFSYSNSLQLSSVKWMFLNVPLLYWAPESHERIKGACRCKELNTSEATKRKWPTGMVSHFILIAWIMELVSKANVSCFIAFHSPPCFIALSKLFFPLKSQLSPHMAFFVHPKKHTHMGNVEMVFITD